MVKISVIMATFNAEKFVADAIEAFRSQSFSDKELLIVDGGSSDRTVEIFTKNSSAISWSTSERDQGIFDAWNKGILNATGDWLYFMGADDAFFNTDSLEKAAEELSRVPDDIMVAYGQVALVDTGGEVGKMLGSPWNASHFRSRGMIIPHQGCFTRRSYFHQYGLFLVDSAGTATYELYLRHLANADAYFLPNLVIGRMAVGGVSTLPENHLKFLNAYVAAQKRHGVFRPSSWMLLQYVLASAKRSLHFLLGRRNSIRLIENARVLFGKKRLFK